MKKITVIIFAVAAFGCTKKMSPSTTAVTPAVEPTPPATPPPPATARLNLAMLAVGQKTYEANCGKCHELKAPVDYTQDRWVGLMNWMAPKARLDSTQKANALAYVQANAKDAPKDKAGM